MAAGDVVEQRRPLGDAIGLVELAQRVGVATPDRSRTGRRGSGPWRALLPRSWRWPGATAAHTTAAIASPLAKFPIAPSFRQSRSASRYGHERCPRRAGDGAERGDGRQARRGARRRAAGGVRERRRWRDARSTAGRARSSARRSCCASARRRAAAFERLRARVVELHPYEVPEVVALPIEAAHAPYLAWITASVELKARRGGRVAARGGGRARRRRAACRGGRCRRS